MKQWLIQNGTIITTILGFIYAAIEFYNQWISVNGWDWKKFIPPFLIFAISWFIKGGSAKDKVTRNSYPAEDLTPAMKSEITKV